MSVTVYKDANFGGLYSRIGSGTLTGRHIVGCRGRYQQDCEPIDGEISSMRVDPNTIVNISPSRSKYSNDSNSRVIIGPVEISDLTSYGKPASITVSEYNPYTGYAPSEWVSIGSYGRYTDIRVGNYTRNRLNSSEVNFASQQVMSIVVPAGLVAILYEGDEHQPTDHAVMIVGPQRVEDVETYGMRDRVNSIRVVYGARQPMPMQAVPVPMQQQQSMPQQSMPQQPMPQQSMPQQPMPQQSMPQQPMPQQSMPPQPMQPQSMPQQSMQPHRARPPMRKKSRPRGYDDTPHPSELYIWGFNMNDIILIVIIGIVLILLRELLSKTAIETYGSTSNIKSTEKISVEAPP